MNKLFSLIQKKSNELAAAMNCNTPDQDEIDRLESELEELEFELEEQEADKYDHGSAEF